MSDKTIQAVTDEYFKKAEDNPNLFKGSLKDLSKPIQELTEEMKGEKKPDKKIRITKCGDCKHCSSITTTDGSYLCHDNYKDERQLDWKTIPDTNAIADFCKLEDY